MVTVVVVDDQWFFTGSLIECGFGERDGLRVTDSSSSG